MPDQLQPTTASPPIASPPPSRLRNADEAGYAGQPRCSRRPVRLKAPAGADSTTSGATRR